MSANEPAKVNVWMLTVDYGQGISTSVHRSEADAIARLFDEYDPDAEFPRDDIQPVMDEYGLTVYIEPHWVEL